MLPQSHLAVVTRNETWTGPGNFATEPHECGWAHEALVFIRALKPPHWHHGAAVAELQISPDGMHWVNHGTTIPLPDAEGETTVVGLRHFGGWLRLSVDLTVGDSVTILVSLHLKA